MKILGVVIVAATCSIASSALVWMKMSDRIDAIDARIELHAVYGEIEAGDINDILKRIATLEDGTGIRNPHPLHRE